LCGVGPPPVEDAAGGPPGVPQVPAACGGIGLPDASGVDRLPIAGAVLSPKPGGRCRPVRTSPDDGVPAAAVPRLRADRPADTFGACGACHTTDGGASPGPAATGIPNAGTTVGSSLSSTAARLTLDVTKNTGEPQ